MATRKSPADEIAGLRREIAEHDRLYYVENNPAISDRDYDRLFERLKELEAAHPELVTPDSPTQRVSETPLDGFRHVRHAVPMMSIDNTYSETDLREFDGRVARGLDGGKYEYLVEPKIDGVSATLRYEGGELVLGATRGDGRTGDDVTANIRTIRAVPLRLHGKGWPEVVEVRGEVYWPRKAFDAFNAVREKSGEERFANPRNAAAGTLKSLDSKVIARRGLSFMAHGVGEITGEPFETASEIFAAFKKWGVPISPHHWVCKDIDEVVRFVEQWEKKRHALEYETDGLVIKVNRFDQRDILGATSRFPRWCIAYKYAAEQAESKLLNVDFQVGKLGTITPRAVMEPTQLSGTTVRHASLHNFDQVERLGEGHDGLRIGDTVLVEKAGEIIPQVLRITREGKPRGARIKPPSRCPVCGGEVEKDEGGVYIRCINPSCEAQLKVRLIYFCGRDQMDIKGIGVALVERLVDEGFVRNLADLYDLTKHQDELAALIMDEAEFGAEEADAFLSGIENARKQRLDRLEEAIPKNARLPLRKDDMRKLKRHFQYFEDFASASRSDIRAALGNDSEGTERVFAFLSATNCVDIVKNLRFLIDKGVLSVKGIGDTTLERIVSAQLIMRVADIFDLHTRREQLISLKFPRTFGKQNTKVLINSLEESKSQPLSRVLAAINIRHVGVATAELIAESNDFGDMEAIAKASEKDLQKIDGIGPEVAKSIRTFFTSAAGSKAWKALADAGVNMKQPKTRRSGAQPLAGKTIVVTGTLEKYSRSEIEKLIKELGGKTAGSVSKKTDYVIVGEEAGSKLEKAKAIGIKTLSEQDFISMIRNASDGNT